MKEKASYANWRHHFHISDDLKSLNYESIDKHQAIIVAGVDVRLYDQIQSVQNDLFAGVYPGVVEDEIDIHFWIPDDIENSEIKMFMEYQATGYAIILKNYLQQNKLRIINFTAMRRAPSFQDEIKLSIPVNVLLENEAGEHVKHGWSLNKDE